MNSSDFERFDPTEESLWYGQSRKTPYRLDFIYFFVGGKNLATKEKFSNEYVDYLNKKWQIQKVVTNEKIERYLNLWYEFFLDKDLYLRLSSKLELTKTLLSWGVYQHEVYLGKKFTLDPNKKWYLKSDHGYAGRGNKVIELKSYSDFISSQEVIVEEYLDRVIDFSIILLDQGDVVVYQNNVSSSGQYLETIISFNNCNNIEKFLESFKITKEQISIFIINFKKIQNFYKDKFNIVDLLGSFDFFIFRRKEQLLIHPCCEFNPRWTMGRVAWHIASKYNSCNKNFFRSCFSQDVREGYEVISPPDAKIKFQVKWYN